MSRTLIYNVRIADSLKDWPVGWLVIDDGFIEDLGPGDYSQPLQSFDEVFDGNKALLMPGVIDEHVHFREPGMTHKGNIETESRAAAAGGVTTFFDMPNTKPATTTLEAWNDKMEIARGKSMVNYAFFLGATPDNIDTLSQADYSQIPGIKLFMGSTTGTQATSSDTFFEKLFTHTRAIIAVHAEDEEEIATSRERVMQMQSDPGVVYHPYIRCRRACVKATQKIIALAHRYKHRIHLMHISTADELSLLENVPADKKIVTAETCPQYLIFNNEDYIIRGTRIKCNPAIKSEADRRDLIEALKSGKIDTVATDHAPHLITEKQGTAITAASGMPGVQFSLPLMLGIARDNGMTASDISRLMSGNPASIWHIDRRGLIEKGYHADLVMIEESDNITVSDDMVKSPCGWTPYEGIELRYTVRNTWVNGVLVFDKVKGLLNYVGAAMPVRFNH